MGAPEARRARRKRMSVALLSNVAAAVLLLLSTLVCLAVVVSSHVIQASGDETAEMSENRQSAWALLAGLLFYAQASERAALEPGQPGKAALIDAEGQLHRALETTRARATDDARRAVVDDASRATTALMVGRRKAETRNLEVGQMIASTGPDLQAASDAARRLVELDQRRFEVARQQHRHVDVSGMALGLGMGLLAVGSVVVAKVVLYRRIRDPVLELTRSVRLFTQGNRNERAREEGAREIAEAARNFNELADTLEQQHERMGKFLERIGGELLDTIGVVRAALETLLPGHDGKMTAAHVHTRTMAAARSLGDIEQKVRDFVAAHRVEMAKMDMRLVRRDLRDLVHDSVKLHETDATRGRVLLSKDEEPLPVDVDLVGLGELTGCLLRRAIERSPEEHRVQVHVWRQGDVAAIDVTDRGPRIPPEECERMFLPFHKCPKCGIQGGPGVELSIARRIVRAHGGRIDVRSNDAEGTTFRVRLPLATASRKEEGDGVAPGTVATPAEREKAELHGGQRPQSREHGA
jgi:signal transduction histidine kinase